MPVVSLICVRAFEFGYCPVRFELVIVRSREVRRNHGDITVDAPSHRRASVLHSCEPYLFIIVGIHVLYEIFPDSTDIPTSGGTPYSFLFEVVTESMHKFQELHITCLPEDREPRSKERDDDARIPEPFVGALVKPTIDRSALFEFGNESSQFLFGRSEDNFVFSEDAEVFWIIHRLRG